MNYIGLGVGKTVQNVITVIKIASIIIFVIAGLAVGTETPDFRSVSYTHLTLPTNREV